MLKSLLPVVVILLAVNSLCQAKCRFNARFRPVNLHFDELANKRFNVVYLSGNDKANDVDHAYIDMKKNRYGIYNSMSTIIKSLWTCENRRNLKMAKLVMCLVLKPDDSITVCTLNASASGQESSISGIGNEIVVIAVILAKTNEGAMLFHLCSDSIEVNDVEDVRYILVPDGVTLADESVNHLMDVDKKFNFNTSLFKLPNVVPVTNRSEQKTARYVLNMNTGME